MIFLATFAGLGAIGFFLLIHAMLFAPEGCEDQQGFRVITPEDRKRDPSDPSPLTATDLMFIGR